MTNTKFRKRALLSSVAMLLVALVALGSATFAWFMSDPNATASGITARANTSLGLLVKTDTDDNWSHQATLYKNISGASILVPATTINGTDYFTAQAAAANAAAADTATGKKWDTVTVADHERTTGGVYKENIYLKVTGGNGGTVTLNSVSLNLASVQMAGAITVCVVKEGTIVDEWNSGGTAVSKWTGITAANATNTQVVAANGTAKTCKASGAGNIELGTLADGAEMTLSVYVYLDGANSQVYTDNAHVSQILNGLTFSFTAS